MRPLRHAGYRSSTPESALADYEAAARWYQRQHPEVGVRFRLAVSDCIKRIAAAPRLCPKLGDGTRRANAQSFPDFILYAEKPGPVQIVAILHGRRHPDAWASGFGAPSADRDWRGRDAMQPA